MKTIRLKFVTSVMMITLIHPTAFAAGRASIPANISPRVVSTAVTRSTALPSTTVNTNTSTYPTIVMTNQTTDTSPNIYRRKKHGKQTYLTSADESSTNKRNPLTGEINLTTNYVFRGISYTHNHEALQGEITYTFLTTGVYLDLWGSNVDFYDNRGNATTVEIDTKIGIANPIGEHFNYDFNIVRYNYPNGSGVSYDELVLNGKYYFVTVEYGYSVHVFATNEIGQYYNLGFNYDIPAKYAFGINDVNIRGGIGHYSLPRNYGLYSYNDYNLQINKSFGRYNIALQWTDTNGRAQLGSLADSHIIGTFTINF